MTQPALDWFRKRGLILKEEVTEGTDSVPVVGTNGIRLLNGRCGTEFDKKERQIDRAFFTNHPFSVANKRAWIEGTFELYAPSAPGNASATGDPDCGLLLKIAGMSPTKSLTAGVIAQTKFNPISSGIISASGYWWHVDEKVKVLGSRANISQLKMEIGERFSGQVRITGNYTVFEEETIGAITLPTTVPIVSEYSNSTAYLDADAEGAGAELLVWAKSLQVDFNNALGTKEYTSVKKNQISDRLATWTMRIARMDLSDFNPWTLRDAGTIIAARYRTEESSSTNNFSELGIRGQIEGIEQVDIDGDLGIELSGPCIATDSGGDEFYVNFGDATPP